MSADAASAPIQRPGPGGKRSAEWPRLIGVCALLLGALHLACFGWVVVQRFRFPVELEWMSGGVSDHVERVASRKPLYGAPSAEFIPYLYPPLHYVLSAALAKLLIVQAASRAVSTAATVIVASLVFRTTRRLSCSTFWALAAVSLYIGAYSATGFWYDLDRSDSLLMAMLVGGFAVLLESDSDVTAVVAGGLLGSAFLAKQPGLVFFGAAILALVVAGRLRRAVALGAGGLVVLVPSVVYLTVSTHGWFWFYCVKMPAAHGIQTELFSLFLVPDIGNLFAFFGVAFFVSACFIAQSWASLRGRGKPSESTSLLGAMVLAGLFTTCTSRLHQGGHVNVLMFMTTFAAIAFGVTASRATADGSRPALGGVLAAVVCFQLVHFLYDPNGVVPSENRIRDARALRSRIEAMEKEGEIVMSGRGHVTEPRHFHIMALIDLTKTGIGLPPDLASGLAARKYAAYIIDEPGELYPPMPPDQNRTELFELVARNYFVAERWDDGEAPPVVGWWAHPSWVLRPRRTPLPTLPLEKLERRNRLEMAIAEFRMRAKREGFPDAAPLTDIESAAALGEP